MANLVKKMFQSQLISLINFERDYEKVIYGNYTPSRDQISSENSIHPRWSQNGHGKARD